MTEEIAQVFLYMLRGVTSALRLCAVINEKWTQCGRYRMTTCFAIVIIMYSKILRKTSTSTMSRSMKRGARGIAKT